MVCPGAYGQPSITNIYTSSVQRAAQNTPNCSCTNSVSCGKECCALLSFKLGRTPHIHFPEELSEEPAICPSVYICPWAAAPSAQVGGVWGGGCSRRLMRGGLERGQDSRPSPAAQQIKPHFIVLSSIEKILLIPRLLAAIVDFQYSPEAVTIIVTFTKDYGQSTSTQKMQCSWFSLSQSIATKYINTLKLLYIQSILWLLNRHNSNNKEGKK